MNPIKGSRYVYYKQCWGNYEVIYTMRVAFFPMLMWICDQTGINFMIELNWGNISLPGNKTKTNNNQNCALCCNFSISISVMLVIYLVTKSFSTQQPVSLFDMTFFQYLYIIKMHFGKLDRQIKDHYTSFRGLVTVIRIFSRFLSF